MSSPDANTVSLAAFTALGTIVGYLGTEVGSSSIFDRMLWASRFYDDANLKSFIAYGFLMSIGGPIHKAAVEALDGLVEAGLWKGYCRGDMLGTCFFKDTKHGYVERKAGNHRGPRYDARNAFWITVLSLVPWQAETGYHNDEADRPPVNIVRAQRPVHLLRLSRANSILTNPSKGGGSVINGDIGPIKARHVIAVASSELITLVIGIVTAAVWKSPFSVWYLTPLLIKMTALLCQVRRKHINPLSKKPEENKPILCEIEDCSKGHFLIEGKSELVIQFFRHYAHPKRHRKGILGDRLWEVVSMLTVVATIFVYPAGLIVFIFAPIKVQWVWLGYQLYAMIAMHVYRFGHAQHLGTTQKWIGRELGRKKQVILDDGSGNPIMACLETSIVPSVVQGRAEVERLVKQVLDEHAAQGQAVKRV